MSTTRLSCLPHLTLSMTGTRRFGNRIYQSISSLNLAPKPVISHSRPAPVFRSLHTTPRIMSPSQSNGSAPKGLTRDNINPAVLEVSYAVRGELALKADKYMHQLEDGEGGELPFDRVVTANIGNPQQKGLDQRPITFWRQVISLLEYPALMEEHIELARKIYPEDAITRAQGLHAEIGSVGAYTHSKGILGIRKRIAKYIEGMLLSHRSTGVADSPERDGFTSDPESIFLTAGASAGVSLICGVALQKGDGVMIPIPQYPLYTATLAYLSAHPLPYYLDESGGWSMSYDSLKETISKARADNVPVKALVIINPGNPTGGCLAEESMRDVVQLCYDIFEPDSKPFVSFKQVVRSMSKEVAEGTQLVSFHSISKGTSGECGRRGGYFELANIREEVVEQIYKMASIMLCPPVTGQVSHSYLCRWSGMLIGV
jgi:alanine transaminase